VMLRIYGSEASYSCEAKRAAARSKRLAFKCSEDWRGCCCLLKGLTMGCFLCGSRLVKLTFPKEGSLLKSSESVIPNMDELDLRSLFELDLASSVGLKVHSLACFSYSYSTVDLSRFFSDDRYLDILKRSTHRSPLLMVLDIISGLKVHFTSSLSSDVYLFSLRLLGNCRSWASISPVLCTH